LLRYLAGGTQTPEHPLTTKSVKRQVGFAGPPAGN
jgi:hypothetical protein